ncbi:MAG: DUF2264 domain-containing protein, partial [Candidatus Limnocylindria bacterium]
MINGLAATAEGEIRGVELSDPNRSTVPTNPKRDWEALALRLLGSLLAGASPGRASILVPGGRASQGGVAVDGLEAFARSLYLAAPLLVDGASHRLVVGKSEVD